MMTSIIIDRVSFKNDEAYVRTNSVGIFMVLLKVMTSKNTHVKKSPNVIRRYEEL